MLMSSEAAPRLGGGGARLGARGIWRGVGSGGAGGAEVIEIVLCGRAVRVRGTGTGLESGPKDLWDPRNMGSKYARCRDIIFLN